MLVLTGVQAWLRRFEQASTTMTSLVDPAMVNPNRFVRTPKLAPLLCTCGFQSTVGRPPNVEAQPVAPNK